MESQGVAELGWAVTEKLAVIRAAVALSSLVAAGIDSVNRYQPRPKPDVAGIG